MRKRIYSLLLCGAMLTATLFGCGNSEGGSTAAGNQTGDATTQTTTSKDGGLDVGIVLPTKDEPRWLQDQKQFDKILGEQGFSSKVLFSQGKAETEKTNVEALINDGVKVLIICAQDATAGGAAVQEAKDAGVTVICYDRLITDTEAVDYYVTFDSVAVGRAQGQYLIDNAPAAKGVPLYLYAGGATDNNAFLFFQGAWEVLQPYVADGTFVIANSDEANKLADKAELTKDEQAKIIGQVTTDWDFNVAKSKAEAHLTADADVKSYVITGQDAEVASVNYIANGKQSMTVFKNTSTLAADSCAMAAAILNNTTPETVTTYNNGKKDVPAKQTDIVVVTKDNVKAALIDSGYYTEDQLK